MKREKVTVTVRSWEDSDFCMRDVLEIDGKECFRVAPLCECPEDAIIGRDLISSDDIASFLKNFLIKHKGKEVEFVYEEGDNEA